VHAYALDAASMDTIVTRVAAAAESSGVKELFPTADGKSRLAQGRLPVDEIQFGYRDGISEPKLEWPAQGAKRDASTLNNFVIGYPPATTRPAGSRRTAATTHSA
jgi:hypothetical protein